jgi:hypothetical protein
MAKPVPGFAEQQNKRRGAAREKDAGLGFALELDTERSKCGDDKQQRDSENRPNYALPSVGIRRA